MKQHALNWQTRKQAKLARAVKTATIGHTSKGQTQHPSASKKPSGNIYFDFFGVLWLQPAARMPNIRREKGEKRLRFDVDRGAGGSQSFMPTRTAA